MEPFTGAVPATVHGHYRVRPARSGDASGTGPGGAPLLVGFHGYGETAADHLPELERIPGADGWNLVAVQALHPFYKRSGEVVASWMTRFDRERAIADNTAYAAAAVEAVRRELAPGGGPPPSGSSGGPPLVFAGFSQGVAMAYRAAAAVPCHGLIALAGDVPPDVDPAELPPVLVGRGTRDQWYREAKMAADLERLEAAGVPVTPCVFDGGHEWAEPFLRAAGELLAARRRG